MNTYSTSNLSEDALEEIRQALKDLDYGSVEIYVQNSEITQITKRTIKKTARKNGSGKNQVLTKVL